MMIGSIVTILVDYPCGTDEVENNYVKGETGVITDYNEETNDYAVSILPHERFPWWFSKEEIRLATNEEIAGKLRFIMMD